MSQAPGAGADDDEESVGLFSIFKKTDQPRPDEAPDPLSDDDAAVLIRVRSPSLLTAY